MPKNVLIYTRAEVVELVRQDAQKRTGQVVLASKIEGNGGEGATVTLDPLGVTNA